MLSIEYSETSTRRTYFFKLPTTDQASHHFKILLDDNNELYYQAYRNQAQQAAGTITTLAPIATRHRRIHVVITIIIPLYRNVLNIPTFARPVPDLQIQSIVYDCPRVNF